MLTSRYESRITPNNDGFYALIVRLDRDGSEQVIHGYKGRQFETLAKAEKSTARYLKTVG